MKLNILYRTSCKDNYSPRMGLIEKTDWGGRCLQSLITTIEDSNYLRDLLDLQVHVLDDASIPVWKETVEHKFKIFNLPALWIPIEGTGNGPSLKFNVDYALNKCEDLIFMVEDDWLFKPEAIDQMLRTYFMFKEKGIETVIHPADYPDRYYREMYPSFIYVGNDRHWRTIKHTTCTIMFNHSTLKDHYSHFEGLKNFGVVPGWGEDQCLNKVYEHVMCLSPMPSLATHYQHPAHMSPFWDKV